MVWGKVRWAQVHNYNSLYRMGAGTGSKTIPKGASKVGGWQSWATECLLLFWLSFWKLNLNFLSAMLSSPQLFRSSYNFSLSYQQRGQSLSHYKAPEWKSCNQRSVLWLLNQYDTEQLNHSEPRFDQYQLQDPLAPAWSPCWDTSGDGNGDVISRGYRMTSRGPWIWPDLSK